MSATSLLERLRALRVALAVQDGELKLRAPRGALDAALLAEVKAHKPALLDLLAAEAARLTPARVPLAGLDQAELDALVADVPGGAANVQDVYPLAPLQEGILFHHQLQQEGDTYLLRSLMAFDTRARLDDFLAALQRVIARHDILRSAVRWEGLERPLQIVQREAPLALEQLDIGAGESAHEVLLAATDPRRLRLDLRRAPLLRGVCAFDAAAGEWLLALLYHHLVCDHVTLDLVAQEIRLILGGREAELPRPLPFRDFIAQPRADAAEHEAYFRRELGDVDTPTLPYGVADVQHDGAGVTETRRVLDAALAARIRAGARRLGVAPAVLFHVAWAQVLGRVSGREDVVFGTVLLGRMAGAQGSDRMLGMFLNTLPLRMPLGGASAEAAVRDMRLRLVELLAHEQAPLALAQRCSGVAAPQPLFAALLNYRHSSAEVAEGSGLEGVRALGADTRNNYPLTLSVEDLGEAFWLTALAADGVDGDAVTRYTEVAIAGLVDALAQAPATPLQHLPVVPAAEAQRWLALGAGPDSTRFRAASLPEQIAQQAARTPQAVAVRQGETTLSYAALQAKAERLAQLLAEQGVQPGERVGVHLERCAELPIALLGVLRSGAAYVMLDPQQPPERLARIVADAGLRVVLLDSRRAVVPPAGLDLIYLDDAAADADWLADYAGAAAAVAIVPDDSAYVLYTSGSTGAPKGVEIAHRGLTDYCAFAREGYYTDDLAGSLVLTSPAFDLSIPSLYVPLLCGGTVELMPAQEEIAAVVARLDGDAPASLLRMTPSHAQALLALADAQPRATRHVFVIGGEAFEPALAQALQAKFPQARLYNHYGPTETVVGCCWYDVSAAGIAPARSLPIGRPMANTRLYVLDAQARPLPPGVAGELLIGGAGVAKGYLHQPELTAQKFIADPWQAGERVYRSGDRVRWNAQGELEFLGRLDDQVKLRGFRIELGEVHSALLRVEGVREAAVTVLGEGAAARLVGYVVPAAAPSASGDFLARVQVALRAQLPPYMLPQALVPLERLPLTANGKLDRRALPPPADTLAADLPPATPTEQALAQIWSALLQREGLGRNAHFFELGGHSLLATRVASEIGRRFGKPVAVRALFEHPTLQALAAHVDAQRREGYAPIPPADRDGALPASFAQQRLWFIDRLEGGSAQYNMPIALRLRGQLDRRALQQALDALVARHEILRTVYAEAAGEALQRVREAAPVPLEVVALDAATEADADAQLQVLALEEANRPFDLAADLMLRARLVELGEADQALLFTLHHIAADGWSLGVLVREFAQLYAAGAQGRAAPLPALPVQYADYAAWQRARLQGAALAQQLDYWRGQLEGLPTLHALPLDRPRPARQRFAGASVDATLDTATLAALHGLARAHGASLFMLLEAAFAVLLARWSGETDIVIGTPIAGRLHPDVEPLIGFFVNTLALRTDLSDAPSFATVLARTRATALAAYAHQEVPFEMLVEELKPARSLAHTPLFQVLFALRNHEVDELRLPGLSISPSVAAGEQAKFDLQLAATETPQGLHLNWLYATSLFDAASIERLAQAYLRLLRGILAAPDTPVNNLTLLDEADRRRLAQWNATARPYPREARIHEVFAAVAARQPDAVALRLDGASLSYVELERRANRIAHALIARGVSRGDHVGLCVERGFDLVAGLLGILKAGAAYVALDPAYPAARLAFLLQDCGAAVVVTQSELCARMEFDAKTLLRLDLPADLADAPEQAPAVAGEGGDLAFVLYTSGSTGRPKGVRLPHRTIVNLLDGLAARHPLLAAPLPTLQFATINFDMSLYEIANALFSGGSVVLLHEAQRLDFAELFALLRREEVGRVYLPTALLAPFAQAALAADVALPALRLVQVAGEALAISPAVREWAARSGCALLNLYGPTESHVVSESLLEGDPALWPALPSIGAPIDNVQLHVLDAQQRPLPPGVVGELYIGGDGLARDYHGRPDLTAERFVELALDGAAPQRLYRSGDLVRWREDGRLDYLGRADTQVKLRGVRIELAEIETLLRAHADVAEAVVLALGEGEDKRLVAYVASARADAALAEELRGALQAQLPAAMLPAATVVLPRLPLTANGKVDRRALPAPTFAVAEFVAPATPTEIAVAEVWAPLLGDAALGRDAHFFELGGHSLAATRAASALAQRLGKPVAVRALFEFPVLRDVAAHLDALDADATDSLSLGPIPRADRAAPLPLSFAQQRLWFVDRLDGGSRAYHLPAAFRVRGVLDRSALQGAFDALLARHEVLRTTYVAQGEGAVQTVHAAAPLDLAEDDLRGVPAAEQERLLQRLAEHEAAREFDLACDRMLRVRCILLDADDSVLLLTLHHIAADGWSLGVLVREFGALYTALAAGRRPALPVLPIQYADYAAWQRARLAGAGLQTQLDYWRRQLDGLPLVHALPLDRPRPPQQRSAGARHRQRLDAAQLARLKALALQHGCSLFMLLQAAFAALLARWSGENDIVIGTPVAGRQHAALAPLIGCFVNTLVLRNDLSGAPDFVTLLARTRQLALDAYAHQELPFEQLVEALQPTRSLAHTPLFQVQFSLHNNEQPGLDLPGLSLTALEPPADHAKYELQLSAAEDEDGLALSWLYARNLFDAPSIERMARAYLRLLDAVLAAPQQPLERVDLLEPAETAALLALGQGPQDARGRDAALPEQIAQQARRTPQAIAVRCGAVALSYAELEAKANRLAQALAARGIGRGARVGVHLERSAELIVALLGVMKSGAAYVPLDARQLPRRLAAIVADAELRVVLADSRRCVLDTADLDLVPMDAAASDAAWLAEFPAQAPARAIDGDDIVYVLYTSGSTGQPKGVEIRHAGLVDYCAFARAGYYAPDLAGSLVLTSPAFDLTVPSLYVPLLAGGCVELMPAEGELPVLAERLDGADAPAALLRLTPSHLQGLLALADAAPRPQAHAFVVGGEAFDIALAQALRRKFPAARVINHYGPTEAVVGCAWYDVGAHFAALERTIPIGRPMDNTRLYVLNPAGMPQPVGVGGELYIGGAGVARGYLKRPELSAQKFLADPFVPGERVYRSGDRVRWRADGNLEFLGRLDDQVKLRGFRIELGDVESALKAHAGVREAVAAVRGEGGAARLVAYVVPAAAAFDLAALQAHLAAELPAYMQPQAVVALERLPLSANGKVDRRALPEPALAAPEYVAPATDTERRLADLWSEVLEREEISVTADFFALGGHSLLAMRLANALKQRLGAELPLRLLFERSDIRSLAAHLDAQAIRRHTLAQAAAKTQHVELEW